MLGDLKTEVINFSFQSPTEEDADENVKDLVDQVFKKMVNIFYYAFVFFNKIHQ